MPLTSEIKSHDIMKFQTPLRAIFSGSSQSGKTFLIGKILEKQKQLFQNSFSFVKYFYPKYLDESPVDYHSLTTTPVSYEAGFPTKEDILNLPEKSLLVIDDMADTALKKDWISQLFKVISGKRNISVILVTQNYFLQGKHSRDIRNSCNYVALFRNCADYTINVRAATKFGLKKAYEAAEKDLYSSQVYPYVFIDQTQRAQLSNFRLYVDILGPVRIGYDNQGMKGYILTEKEFLAAYTIFKVKEKTVLATRRYEDPSNAVHGTSDGDQSEKRKTKKRRTEEV